MMVEETQILGTTVQILGARATWYLVFMRPSIVVIQNTVTQTHGLPATSAKKGRPCMCMLNGTI
jgi:hypothetical protein